MGRVEVEISVIIKMRMIRSVVGKIYLQRLFFVIRDLKKEIIVLATFKMGLLLTGRKNSKIKIFNSI